jgi:hypothetical protein
MMVWVNGQPIGRIVLNVKFPADVVSPVMLFVIFERRFIQPFPPRTTRSFRFTIARGKSGGGINGPKSGK